MPQEVVQLKISVDGYDEASKNLQALDDLADKLNSKTIKIDVDTSSLKQMEASVEKRLQIVTEYINAQARLATAQNKVAAEEAKIAQQVEKTAQAQAKAEAVEQRRRLLAEQMSAAQDKAARSAENYKNSVDKISKTPLQEQIDALVGVDRQFKSAEESAKALLAAEQKLGSVTGDRIDTGRISTSRMEDYIQNVQKMENATVAATKSVKVGEQTFQQFSVSAKNAAGDFDNYTFSVDTATGAVHKLDNGMSTTNKTAGKLGQTIGSQIADFIKWSAMAVLVYAPLQALGDAVQELKAVDAELVNIQKVMGATAGEMETLSQKAYEVGSALGIAASDYLASVNKWAQAGYGSLSDELGELSVKTQLVGDVQEETANQFLLSVDAAYQYKGNIEALTRVLDGANAISNNYATSVEKLAGGMGIVSSLAAQAGMEVQETMAAIGTITAVTQESGNSAARALRALILNIQGSTEIAVDEATGERWTEDEIEATAAALGDLNIATREYKDGVESLRNPMEVIGELSDKYRQGLISEVQLQEVVSSLGGKVRSNQLQALISNYDLYEQMLDTYSESVGSADRDLDIYLASWEAKTKRLHNQWVELVDSFKVSELSMGLLDIGNALLEIANTDLEPVAKWADAIGSLGDGKTSTGIEEVGDAITESAAAVGKLVVQIVAVTAALVALKAVTSGLEETNFGKGAKGFLGDLLSGLKSVPKAASDAKGSLTGLSGALSGLKGGASQLGSTLVSSFGLVPLAIAAITAEIIIGKKLIDNFIANDRYNKKLQEIADEYNEISAEVEALNSELETTQDRIDELNEKDTLTLTEQAELDRLKTMNSLLETQIELKKEAQREAANDVINAANDAINKGGFGGDQSAINGATFANIGALGFAALNPGSILLALGGRYIFDKTYLRDWDSQIKKLDEEMETAIKENNLERVETLKELQADMLEQLNEELQNLDLEEMEAGDPEKLKEVLNSYQDLQFRITAISDPLGAVATRLEQFENNLSPEKLEEYNKRLEELGADGKVTANEVKALAETFPFLNDLVDSGAVTWDDLGQHFTSVANEAGSASGSLDALGDSVNESDEDAKDLTEALDGLTSNLKSLSEAQNELSKNGELSIDTVLSLMEKIPELESVLVDYLAGVASETELQEALADAYSDNADAYQQSILEKMYDNQEFYKNVILTNTDIVSKLAALGITDLENYESIADLKAAVNEQFNAEAQKNARETRDENSEAYVDEADAFVKSRQAMLEADNFVAQRLKRDADIDFTNGGKSTRNRSGAQSGQASEELSNLLAQLDSILNDAIELPDFDLDDDSGGSGGGGRSEAVKDWYEERIQAMNDLVAYTRDTNTLLEKEDKDSLEKRAQNLTNVLAQIHQTASEFRDQKLTDESEQVQELKLLWHEVYEERQALYESLYDDLTDTLADQEWDLDLFQKNRERADRSVEEIAEDCQKIVSEYKSMQEEVADLAAYYRSMGYDETDDLIQNLSDKWWEYQETIESVYDALTEAFEDYISESDRQIRALERTTGTAGQQIELYTQRINEAHKTLQALQATNVNGINDDLIGNVQDQIYSDEDAISNIQDELWAELEAAVDKEFDKWQDKIDEANKELDRVNQIVADLDGQMQEAIEPLQEQIEAWQDALEDRVEPLEDAIDALTDEMESALKPIEEKLEELNDRLEAEREALENLVAPLEKQIEGYYTVNPDGTVGVYVPGLNDQIEDLQDKLDEENRKWDEQQERDEQALALQKKELALQEAIKNLEQAQLDLETAKNERTVYTLKDGVWAWRPDDQAIQEAEDALEDAEQAKEDAEQELEDLKEQQAHDKIISSLEDQIEALEKQKELIEAQIDIYERESEARQDYLQDQIDFWEKEQEAQEDYYNDLIEAHEKEIEAWEDYYNDLIEAHEKEIEAIQDHYEDLKAQYDDEIEFWEGRIEELQGKYDAWMEEWEGIQDAIQEPARSIAEILDDIARYGTPAMKEQVDNIVDLLTDMGVALDDFNSSIDTGGNFGGNQGGGGSQSEQSIIDQMKANADAWWNAWNRGDTAEMERLENLNQQLGNSIRAWRDYDGVWWDRYGNKLFEMGSGSSGWSGGSSSPGNSFSGGSSTSGGGSYQGAGASKDVLYELNSIRSKAQYAGGVDKRALFDEANALAVSNGAVSIPYSPNVNDWLWYDSAGNRLFDQGGVAHGTGVLLKGTEAPQLVLSPVLAADVLNPVKNTEFDRFAKDLGIMFGAAQNYAPDTRTTPSGSVTTNNTDSHNIYINGVEIGESMLDRPLSEILDLLGIHRDY